MECWPENIDSLNLFIALQTQWRIGMSGATGLDYPAVFATLDRLHRDKTDARRDELFADVQIMEAAALKKMAEK